MKMSQLAALASGLWFKVHDAPLWGRLEGKVIIFEDGTRTGLLGASISFEELFKEVKTRTTRVISSAPDSTEEEYVYAVVSHYSGRGSYDHENFLGMAFSWKEVMKMIDENRNHPCPGGRWEIQRRSLGNPFAKAGYLSVWKADDWGSVAKRGWQ